MIKRDGKNRYGQKGFEDAPKTLEKIAPVLLAFLTPLISLEFSDFFTLVAHLTGGILYS
jgi:hypothetical protein